MKRTASFTLIVLLTVVMAESAAAQWNVARFDQGGNRIYAAAGLDPAVTTSLGYGRVLPVFGHGVQLSAEVSVGVAELDTKDFRTRVGVQTSLLRWRSVQATGSAVGIVRGTENIIYSGYNFGADIAGTLGVYRPGWFVAGEFGKDKAVITYLEHSDWYRETYYEGAKDGWYLDAGGTFHYGVSAGVTLGRAELMGRMGLRRTEDWEAVTPPAYASVGVGFSF